jgi:hypothetical protein
MRDIASLENMGICKGDYNGCIDLLMYNFINISETNLLCLFNTFLPLFIFEPEHSARLAQSTRCPYDDSMPTLAVDSGELRGD